MGGRRRRDGFLYTIAGHGSGGTQIPTHAAAASPLNATHNRACRSNPKFQATSSKHSSTTFELPPPTLCATSITFDSRQYSPSTLISTTGFHSPTSSLTY
mmetsp:Transcript_128819/g.222577  ORF Transcript_128819/g.222577 Transcript_128819/m.222577 type:complete len:100 (+) Transcript_128819:423-722(+)